MKTVSALLALLGAATAAATAWAESARKNVLFIAVDDLRPALGCYGDPAAITPNLDKLAARGTVFARAYCQQAVCNPSRQSLLSGRRPDRIGVWDLGKLFRDTAPDVVPLPEHFKLNGYFTQAFGKIYHGTAGMTDPQSWSVPEQFAHENKRDDYQREENRRPVKGGKAAATEFVEAVDDDYGDGRVARGAVAALKKFAAEPGKPFFLAVGIRKPHLPFTAPKKYWDLYENVAIPAIQQSAPPEGAPALALHDYVELRGYTDMPEKGPVSAEDAARLRRGYYAAVSFADAQIGRVLDELERSGLAQNTIVVVWGDHGYHLGEQGLWTKVTNYEADVRVPLIVATPGAPKQGVRTEALVEFVDIYPTLIELCGLPPREKLDGKSFAANLGNPQVPGKVGAISQFPRPWKSGKDLKVQNMGYSVRTATHRYVEWRRHGTTDVIARELYAYEGDELFEKKNLADAPTAQPLIAELAKLLPEPPVLN